MTPLEELLKTREILDKVGYKTLTEILDSFLPKIPVNIWEFKNEKFELKQLEMGGTNVLYRGRINDKKQGNNAWSTLDDISYIPEGKLAKIVEFGRVNKPGESMFYCSTHLHTACVETFSKGINYERLKQEGRMHLTVGVWKIEKPLILNLMTHSERYFDSFRGGLDSSQLKRYSIESVKAENARVKEMVGDEQYKILEFFSDEFAKVEIKHDADYMLSNYYADRVFDRNIKFRMNGKIDGIVYPSVPTAYEYDNFLLPPSIVDEKLTFLWAYHIWVSYDAKTGNMSFSPIGSHQKADSTGKFNWIEKL